VFIHEQGGTGPLNLNKVNFFEADGAFTPTQSGRYLVYRFSGGAGAGKYEDGSNVAAGGSGLISVSLEELTAGVEYPVEVGEGGAGSSSPATPAADGSATSFNGRTTPGGRGGTGTDLRDGGVGGSGGGDGTYIGVTGGGTGGVDGADGANRGGPGTPGTGQGEGAFSGMIALIDGLDQYMKPTEGAAHVNLAQGGQGIDVDWSGTQSSYTEYGSGGDVASGTGEAGKGGFLFVYGPL
tara:strand:+ start:152 stop:865 length:714 start_codon:yes stop_codon:yes gene_type:complete